MNWQKKVLSSIFLIAITFGLASCGVKGDPLPPEKPAELGRGRPTYKRATEGIRIEKRPIKDIKDKDEDKDEDDERE